MNINMQTNKRNMRINMYNIRKAQFLVFRDTPVSKICGALFSVTSGNRRDSGLNVVYFEGRRTFAHRI